MRALDVHNTDIGDSDDNNKDSDSSLIANPNGVKVKDIQEGQNEVIIHIDESHTEVKDGGWGWIVVLGCVLLRIIIGMRKWNFLFY